MEYFKWVVGRQTRSTYYKMCLYSFKLFGFGFDGYLLWYPEGTILPQHRDPVDNGEHYRLNITLNGESTFYCADGRGINNDRINYFRPDIYLHSLYAYKNTLKLSLGLVKFKK